MCFFTFSLHLITTECSAWNLKATLYWKTYNTLQDRYETLFKLRRFPLTFHHKNKLLNFNLWWINIFWPVRNWAGSLQRYLISYNIFYLIYLTMMNLIFVFRSCMLRKIHKTFPFIHAQFIYWFILDIASCTRGLRGLRGRTCFLMRACLFPVHCLSVWSNSRAEVNALCQHWQPGEPRAINSERERHFLLVNAILNYYYFIW